jgi:ferredoxin
MNDSIDQQPAIRDDVQSYSVRLQTSGVTISCRADQYVLNAADLAGLMLPAMCREGRCGTCRCKLIAGQVDMQHNGGIRQRHIEQGHILVCCSRPLTDLVIDG